MEAASNRMVDSAPIVVERTYNATPEAVWQAITDRNKMKEWYFDIADFKAEPGFEFQFYGDDGEKKFLHLARIKEVIPGKKLSYTWRYEDSQGDSLVTFEIFPEGDKTRVKLTHEGVDNFDPNNPSFARKNFVAGWNEILGENLSKYLERDK
jgi:uncharacterized protein YndB with AHSA1/START domain